MEPQVIRTPEQHKAALAEVDQLIIVDPEPGTEEAERLDLLATLVEKFEREHFPIEFPTAVDAILCRMEDLGLRQRDLVPYIGSPSKVSEVLNRKRPLTLPMIRALNSYLGIPAKILVQDPPADALTEAATNVPNIPVREIAKRGWIDATEEEIRNEKPNLIQRFLEPLGETALLTPAYLRTTHKRFGRRFDEGALFAWTAKVLMKAQEQKVSQEYNPTTVDDDYLLSVVHLSAEAQGPKKAQEFLAESGIVLVIEPHLPRTLLDGAVLVTPQGLPVIGLTLRYDRLDNFWFTLIHELVHISRHLNAENTAFYDDLDAEVASDSIEREADRVASNVMIPRSMWNRSAAFQQRSTEAIVALSHKLQIHSAIVAGRLRRDTNNYQTFNQLVGHGQVRINFPDVVWP